MADPEKKPTEPEVDMTKIQTAISSAVNAALNEAGERTAAIQRQQEEARRREAAAKAAADNPDPVAEVLRPHLQPMANLLAFKSDDAKDAAIFYAAHPEAKDFSKDIESKATELANAGRPLNRESIYQWLKGSDAYLDKRIKQRDEELKRAREAETLSGSRGAMPTQRPEISPDASDDDLASAVKDLQF